ncbi:Stp1/IreP family PP2C-type Ser/Thr phosphatase [Desmospora activa]|uniref:Protein phosphatase n=1 Tax=Desmospora activa DSM 45169 TaxID=1121389 RepID=A0A2T4ZB53_9BACL|nr:Stp1/IreP family PP2C-type Ser/Thr phosphatase [Desmospora activa]PTM59128.1 protein phosphatase [Desmospora activa DSM 45169]
MEKAWITHKGRVRKDNEDSVCLFQSAKGVDVAVLADGMGGHQAGDVASQAAVRIIQEKLSSLSSAMDTKELRRRASDAAIAANEEVFRLATQNKKYQGMGTTLITAVLGREEIILAHIGDSRAYLLHNNGLYQVTEDHSLVNVLRQHGEITEDEARMHPQRNVIVRSVGTNETVEPDMIVTPWYRGDILLLCSDGLSDMVEVEEIGSILTSPLSLQKQAEQLLQRALDAGGTDNISIVLVKQNNHK